MKKNFLRASDFAQKIILDLKKSQELMLNPVIADGIAAMESALAETKQARPYIENTKVEFYQTTGFYHEELCETLAEACKHLVAMAERKGDKKLADELRISERQLLRMGNNELLEKGARISSLIEQHAADLKVTLYEESEKEQLDILLADYEAQLEGMDEMLQNERMGRTLVEQLHRKITETLAQIDVQMEAYQKGFPQHYASYTELRKQMNRKNKGGVMLYAKIVDERTNRGLGSVRVDFLTDGNSASFEQLKAGKTLEALGETPVLTKRTTSSGRFLCPKMVPGTYCAVVSMNGYKTEVAKVYINENNTFSLNLALQPLA